MILPIALQVVLIVLAIVKRRTVEPADRPDDTTVAPAAHRAAGH
ncbi:hypothetical protein [Streptomyces sp. NPDC017868]